MTPSGQSWRVEETCFNAFPSLQQVLFGTWLMRFSAGLSRRANSVNPLRPECAGIAAAIAAGEALYRAQGLPTIFLNAISSSSAKPCTHHAVAVVAAALAR